MSLRPEERDALTRLVAILARERGTSYRECCNPDPPDLLLEESSGNRRVGIEHTRLVVHDRESIAAWARLYRQVAASADGVSGTYLIGPGTMTMRFPLEKRSVAEVAREIVRAITAYSSWSPGQTLTLDTTGSPDGARVKVTMLEACGSEVVGLPAWGRVSAPALLRNITDRVEDKLKDIRRWPTVDERILLIDAAETSPIRDPSIAENLYDDLWFLSFRGLLSFQTVYLARGEEVARIWPRPGGNGADR